MKIQPTAGARLRPLPRLEREHWLLPSTPYATYADYRARTGASPTLMARARSAHGVLEEIESSGLRGRGGSGFPTGTKWRAVGTHPCVTRHVVCNAAEGEPGTFKDRWLLRQNPYSLLEGMLVAAHAMDTRSLYIGIKASFRIEIARLRRAIAEVGESGLLDGHSLRVVEGPEDYLFGEEKALLEVLSGNDPLPREVHYPPYELGLFPTPSSPNPALVNNVETFSHVAGIVRSGAASFRRLGTEDTPGTLIFTVSGDVRRPGVYEREAGISLRELLHDVAGGPRPGRTIKAALPGFSGGLIGADQLDTRADFGSLHGIGASLGSAGFIVFDDLADMPRVAQTVARFLYAESCNQCSACKAGLGEASAHLDRLCDGPEGTLADVAAALQGARSAPQGNRCYLPVQGALLIPRLLTTYAGEVDARLRAGGAPTEPVRVPQLVDFDGRTHMFLVAAGA